MKKAKIRNIAAKKRKKKKRAVARKVCRLTVDRVVYIDYKDVNLLKHYVSERPTRWPRGMRQASSTTR